MHHNALRLKCNKCNTTFAFVQSLREHHGQCGKGEEEREQYNCHMCDGSFTTKRSARLHKKSHMEILDMCVRIVGRPVDTKAATISTGIISTTDMVDQNLDYI